MTTTRRCLHLDEWLRGHHTSVVFERLDRLALEERLEVVSTYQPDTLRWQIETWCPDDFTWTWIAMGPPTWRAAITRRR